jgi:hypothetical protein
VLACVLVLSSGALVGTASAMPDNISEKIRGLGSDTTIFLMESLDRAYNDSQGCSVLSSPQRLDTVCGTQGPPFGFNGQTVGTLDNWDHDTATSLFPIGSGNGINVLTRFGQTGYPRIDYARSSRARSGSDNPGLRFVAYAEDAIAPAAFRGQISPKSGDPCFIDRGPGAVYDDDGPLGHSFGNNTSGPGATSLGSGLTTDDGTWPPADGGPASSTDCPLPTPASNVQNLTTQNIKDIWENCTLTDWHTLDAHVPSGTAIVVWADQAGSGTRGTWDGFLGAGGNSTTCIPSAFKDGNFNNGERVIFENDATPISGVAPASGNGRIHTCNDVYRSGQSTADCASTFDPQNTAVTQNANGSPLNYTQSIYYFSFGQWQISAGTVGDAEHPKGQGTTLLNWDGNTPSVATIQAQSYPGFRFLFNVYRNSFPQDNAPDWVRDYVGEQGWICKADTDTSGDQGFYHDTDPKTGVNYGVEIENIISANGFVPVPYGPIGGSVVGSSKCRVS